jgi:hypothetical protein
VFVYGEKKRALIPYPDEIVPDADHFRLKADLVSDLADIGKLAGPYRLSQFAREWGRAWYADHNNPDLRPAHLASDRFEGYVARKQTHLHKFAIVLAAAKRDDRVIEEEDLKESDAIISDTERDMIRVFESIGSTVQSAHVNQIVSIVKYTGFMTSKGLWARSMTHMTLKEFEEAVRAAVHSRQLELATQGGMQGVIVPTKKGP